MFKSRTSRTEINSFTEMQFVGCGDAPSSIALNGVVVQSTFALAT
jgi:hypothetical protein